MTSQISNQFCKESITKILKGAGIAAGAAGGIYILQALSSMDFGAFTEIAVALAAILINSLKEFKKGD